MCKKHQAHTTAMLAKSVIPDLAGGVASSFIFWLLEDI
jgi:hypothetical protein